jgi:hypothetical protein
VSLWFARYLIIRAGSVGPVIPSVAAEDADTCFELRFVDAEGTERSAPPKPGNRDPGNLQ